MKETEIALLMKGMAPVIGKLIGQMVEPLVTRVAELEQVIADMPKPQDGRDGLNGKDGTDGRDGADGAPGQDGKDAEPVTAEQIADAVARYLAANPPVAGKDGRDGIDGQDGAAGMDGKDGEPGRDGVDGKDGAPGPNGIDGKDGAPGIDGKDGLPGKDGANGSPGMDGADGKDGVGLAGAVQSKDGHLVLTLTSGATVDVGLIAGRDGRDGSDGAKGADGAAGRDGFGFDELDLVESDEGVSLRFARGDGVKEFALPVVFDRGVYREGVGYRKGNGVTWGGSYWIAQKDGPFKPDTPDSGWRLAVKKGQNGRDAGK
ncbi:collagen-like protein [Devosia ginsengisoli]|uniref:Collagen-like protein n=1 Tax=Devosia ginsengisoli TaxID=400770 RepID=A0A5B8LS07_9HYPH|nr:collagen-like protein [Devosia ginsengisoli]QDZ10525.1 hypothetical protein FPZ08_07035 [Devosia ginsengisoli]